MAAESFVDLKRTEVLDERFPVEVPQRGEGGAMVREFIADVSVGPAIVGLVERPELRDDSISVTLLFPERGGAASGLLFGEKPGVALLRFGGVELSQVIATAREFHESTLPSRRVTVPSMRRDTLLRPRRLEAANPSLT